MLPSAARTVTSYLASLPEGRRKPIAELRRLLLQRLPAGFEERMEYGMISYVVPLSRYPDTYNGKPLAIASLASQKQYMSLYLMSVYGDPEIERWFAEGFRRAGKRLDMGKSCVRFRALDELPLQVIGDAIARVSVDEYIAGYERARGKRPAKKKRASGASRKKRSAQAASLEKTAARSPAAKNAKKASKKKRG